VNHAGHLEAPFRSRPSLPLNAGETAAGACAWRNWTQKPMGWWFLMRVFRILLAVLSWDYHIKYVDLRWFKPSKLTPIEFHCGTTFSVLLPARPLERLAERSAFQLKGLVFFRKIIGNYGISMIYHEKWMVRQQNCLQWPRTAYGSRMFVFRHFWWPKECVQVFPRASLAHCFTLFHQSFQAMLGSPRGRDGRNAADKDDMAPHRTSCGRSHTKSRCPRGKLRLFCAMCIV